MSQPFNAKETARTRARYNRIAPIYNLMEIFAERRFVPWREKLWSLIPGGRVLEEGLSLPRTQRTIASYESAAGSEAARSPTMRTNASSNGPVTAPPRFASSRQAAISENSPTVSDFSSCHGKSGPRRPNHRRG